MPRQTASPDALRSRNDGTEMTHFRLRTQLFIATLLIICGLTGALLLIIRHTVSVETDRQVRDGTEASVRAFASVQRQRAFYSCAARPANRGIPRYKARLAARSGRARPETVGRTRGRCILVVRQWPTL